MKELLIIFCVLFCKSSLSADTVFLLVRHGETDWNIEDRGQGHTNNPLNKKGIIQSKELAEKIVSYKLMILANSHKAEKVCIFTQGEVIKVLISDILDVEKTPSIPNCAVVHINYSSNSHLNKFNLISIE